MKLIESIEQNGQRLFHSDDGISISILAGNLTGSNFKDTEKREYLRYTKMMQRQTGFELGTDIVIFHEDQFGRREVARRKTGIDTKTWVHDPQRSLKAKILKFYRSKKQPIYDKFQAVTDYAQSASATLNVDFERAKIYAIGFFYN